MLLDSFRRRTRWIGILIIAILVLAQPGANPAPVGSAPVSTLDIAYRTVDKVTLYLDGFVPPGAGPFPVMLVVHGGGWRTGKRTSFDKLAQQLTASGYLTFSADYRLAPPGGTWHEMDPVEDLQAAMLWLRANAALYGGDPTRIGALGGSSGAHLVLMLGTTGTPGADRPEAVVSLSGPTDLPRMIEADQATYDKVENYVGCLVTICPSKWDKVSPALRVTPQAAPTFLGISTAEVIPLAQATEMADALTAAGVPVRLEIVEGDHHSQNLLPYLWNTILRFLGRRV